MLEKKALNEEDVQVTFRMPPLDGVVELYLSGEFNSWHKAGAPLSLEPDGSWVVTLVLRAGKSYRFRYLDNQGRWHNDWDADAYVPNDFGTEDSVVDLVASVKKVPQVEVKRARHSEHSRRAKEAGKTPDKPSAKGSAAKGAAGGSAPPGKVAPRGKSAPPNKGRARLR
jgi:hypothetical protein